MIQEFKAKAKATYQYFDGTEWIDVTAPPPNTNHPDRYRIKPTTHLVK